jgi:hypothetical protein
MLWISSIAFVIRKVRFLREAILIYCIELHRIVVNSTALHSIRFYSCAIIIISILSLHWSYTALHCQLPLTLCHTLLFSPVMAPIPEPSGLPSQLLRMRLSWFSSSGTLMMFPSLSKASKVKYRPRQMTSKCVDVAPSQSAPVKTIGGYIYIRFIIILTYFFTCVHLKLVKRGQESYWGKVKHLL